MRYTVIDRKNCADMQTQTIVYSADGEIVPPAVRRPLVHGLYKEQVYNLEDSRTFLACTRKISCAGQNESHAEIWPQDGVLSSKQQYLLEKFKEHSL